MERPSPVPRFMRRMGLTFDNFIPIHQAHSHCRKPLLVVAPRCAGQDSEIHNIISSAVCCLARSENPVTIKYRAAPGTATTGNGDNDTPAQSQSERDSVFQREAVAGNESSRMRTMRG